ncbi:MAG: hypothetical protein JRI56_13150, partial [Deltaproteobacteria bacterium]|nr:hypothetical protein [Deltaproteobacteria bacterium]
YETYKTREEAVKREKELKTGYGRKWLKREIMVENGSSVRLKRGGRGRQVV